MTTVAAQAEKGPLGQKIDAPEVYNPEVLFAVARERGRQLLGLEKDMLNHLPFEGDDVWNAYECSWLNVNGVPRRATLELRIPCTSPCIVESKSLKLYLNSLNFKRFASTAELLDTIKADVGKIVGAPLSASLRNIGPDGEPALFDSATWSCVDDEDVGDLPPEVLDAPNAGHLTLLERQQPGATGGKGAAATSIVTEHLVTHLLRTRCPVTGQPDWGSVLVEYRGAPIARAGFLRYIVSLRREVGFHENAIERITLDLIRRCSPENLRVTGRFLRRGGIDINPVRIAGENTDGVLGPTASQLRVPGQ
mmetsp:Transcript_16917/g.48299  ORF Transcript_16917/g.48299 Transcript_16917/m.48299 type:complete len:308 (+) Transcript_16917:53-976(+)